MSMTFEERGRRSGLGAGLPAAADGPLPPLAVQGERLTANGSRQESP